MLLKIKNYFFEYQWVVMTVSLLLLGWVSFSLSNNPNEYVESTPTNANQLVSAPAKSTSELLPEDLAYIKPVTEILNFVSNDKNISNIQLEYQEEVLIYVINYTDSTKQAFNAMTAENVEFNGTDSSNVDIAASLPLNIDPKISFNDALAVVKTQNPDKAVIKMELTVKTAIVMYNAFFSKDDSLYVSASTGNIVTIPDPEPIQYTVADTNPTNTVTRTNVETSTNSNDKKPSWTTTKKKWKKLVEDYREYYTNRD